MHILREHRGFWNNEHKRSLYLGLLLLALSLIIQIGAGRYSARSAASAPFVGDLFLDNLPVLNLDFVIVEGVFIFWAAAWTLLCFRPRYLLFGIKVIALFIITRAFFISLTHIGIYPERAPLDGQNSIVNLYNLFTFQGNFFFSGHTAFPFLMALIFWREKILRNIFIFFTFFFGMAVLLAHVHYSIDVFAAPFITYGVWRIAASIFPKDRALHY